jgi:hypothetical protein
MLMSTLRNWFVKKANPKPYLRSKLRLEVLEDRTVPTTLFVNDNWVIATDVGPAGLSAGDTVNNSDDAGATPVSATFGTNAFSTINSSIAAASNGDTIEVLQGNYTENVVVDKSVTLEGANAGVSAGLEAGVRGPETVVTGGFSLVADDVTLDGFKILNGATVAGETAGVYFVGSSDGHTIENNILTGTGTGRGILSTFNGTNDNITIRDNDISGWSSGIFNQSNTNVDIIGNSIHDNVAGVANDFVTDVLIQGNDFEDNGEAVGVFGSTGIVVKGNNLDGNTDGINVYDGSSVDARANWWGSPAGPAAGYNSGNVNATTPLGQPISANTSVFTSGGNSLTVNRATGAYTLTLADGTTYTGTGARIVNGKFMIHDQSDNGKVDIKGSADGAVTVSLKGKGKPTTFTLQSIIS